MKIAIFSMAKVSKVEAETWRVSAFSYKLIHVAPRTLAFHKTILEPTFKVSIY